MKNKHVLLTGVALSRLWVVHGDAAKAKGFNRLTNLALALLLPALVVYFWAVAVLIYGPTANGAIT